MQVTQLVLRTFQLTPQGGFERANLFLQFRELFLLQIGRFHPLVDQTLARAPRPLCLETVRLLSKGGLLKLLGLPRFVPEGILRVSLQRELSLLIDLNRFLVYFAILPPGSE